MPDSNTSLTGLYECLLTEKQQEKLQDLELSLTDVGREKWTSRIG